MGITTSNKELSAACIDCGGTFQVKLSLSAEPDFVGNPTDIVLILDRSGSMAGSPLANLKSGAKSSSRSSMKPPTAVRTVRSATAAVSALSALPPPPPGHPADHLGCPAIIEEPMDGCKDAVEFDAGELGLESLGRILQNSISKSNTSCRWGGDEFTVLFFDATRKKIEGCLQRIEEAAKEYNASGAKPEIYYAAGYALSEELPGLSRSELLKAADGRMYQNKKWYDKNVNEESV